MALFSDTKNISSTCLYSRENVVVPLFLFQGHPNALKGNSLLLCIPTIPRLFLRIRHDLGEGNHFRLWRLKNPLLLLFGIIFLDKFPDGHSPEPAVKNSAAGQTFIHGPAIMKGENMPEHAAISIIFIELINHVSSFRQETDDYRPICIDCS